MFSIRRPTESSIRAFLARQETSTFSYSAVGSTRSGNGPVGYVLDHNRVRLGIGDDCWKSAKRAICDWKMFEMNFLHLHWPNVPIAEGNTVAIAVQHFGFWSLNASRIIYVIEEPRRFGFA